MSGAKKIAGWSGHTDSHGFQVAFFEDEEQGIFIANVEARKLVTPSTRRNPGQSVARMAESTEDKLRDEDLDILKARSRTRIQADYGPIHKLREDDRENPNP